MKIPPSLHYSEEGSRFHIIITHMSALMTRAFPKPPREFPTPRKFPKEEDTNNVDGSRYRDGYLVDVPGCTCELGGLGVEKIYFEAAGPSRGGHWPAAQPYPGGRRFDLTATTHLWARPDEEAIFKLGDWIGSRRESIRLFPRIIGIYVYHTGGDQSVCVLLQELKPASLAPPQSPVC